MTAATPAATQVQAPRTVEAELSATNTLLSKLIREIRAHNLDRLLLSDPEISAWEREHAMSAQAREADLRAAAQAKLTPDELRAILNTPR